MSLHILLRDGSHALLDAADEHLCRYNWRRTSSGYVATTLDGKTVYLHRLVMNAPSDKLVDHINGDKLDNRRANLRLVTPHQNAMNRPPVRGFKGVSYEFGKWRARIGYQGRTYSLGSYDNLKTAALIYDCAARHFFGPYAWTNFPEEEVPPEISERFWEILNPPPPISRRSSPYRGVYWDKGKWRARITIDGKHLHLGYFTDEVEAAKAYDAQARLLGRMGSLNFPD